MEAIWPQEVKPQSKQGALQNMQENCRNNKLIIIFEAEAHHWVDEAMMACEGEILAAGEVNKWVNRASGEHSLIVLHVTGRADGGWELLMQLVHQVDKEGFKQLGKKLDPSGNILVRK